MCGRFRKGETVRGVWARRGEPGVCVSLGGGLGSWRGGLGTYVRRAWRTGFVGCEQCLKDFSLGDGRLMSEMVWLSLSWRRWMIGFGEVGWLGVNLSSGRCSGWNLNHVLLDGHVSGE